MPSIGTRGFWKPVFHKSRQISSFFWTCPMTSALFAADHTTNSSLFPRSVTFLPTILVPSANIAARTPRGLSSPPDTHAPPPLNQSEGVLVIDKGYFWGTVFEKSLQISPFLETPMSRALFST